jgi:hypothetical protein
MKISISLLVLFVFGILACNKDKRASKRFIALGIWNVTEMTIEDSVLINRRIRVYDCKIYKTPCTADWRIFANVFSTDPLHSAEFKWQFNEKATKFVIQGPGHCGTCTPEENEAANELNLISGAYKVIVNTRSEIQVESYSTWGFESKRVFLKFERRF